MIEFIVLSIFTVIVAITAWVEFHEVVSEITVLNPESAKGTAVVIYQKGLREFQPTAASAFAKGLASSGWRVEMTTVSPHTPTDLTNYNLLVLGWPTYWFTPSLPIRRYLRRIGDLKGKRTVIICTAAGAPINSCTKMKSLVQATNGIVERSLVLFTMRPNDGNDDPLEIATQVGKEIPLP